MNFFLLLLTMIWFGCSSLNQCHPDKEFMLEYQNCILLVVNHQALAYRGEYTDEEIDELARAISFLEKVTGVKSHIYKEYPFWYLGDSLLAMDVNFWINWYNKAPCEFKQNPYAHLEIKSDHEKEELFPSKLMK